MHTLSRSRGALAAAAFALASSASPLALAEQAASEDTRPVWSKAQIRAALAPVLSCELDLMQAIKDPGRPDPRDPNNPKRLALLAQIEQAELAFEALRQSTEPPDPTAAPAARRDDGVARLRGGPFDALGLQFQRANITAMLGTEVELHSSTLAFAAVKQHLTARGWALTFSTELSDTQPFVAYRASLPDKELVLYSGVVEGYTQSHQGPGVTVRCLMLPQEAGATR